jgi:hypothetical protein
MHKGERFRAAMGTLETAKEETFFVTDEFGQVIEVSKHELSKYENDPYPWSDAMVVNFEQGDNYE